MTLAWLIVIVVVVSIVLRRRARVVVRLAHGQARVVRGRLPTGVVADLGAVATLTPNVSGTVELRGRGSQLDVRTRGLPEGVGQRVRNVVFLRRNDV